MRANVAPVLRERLGEEPTRALVALVDEAGAQVKGEVMDAVTERFGRMLAEECGKVRVAVAEQSARLEVRLVEQRAELLKWSFLFWIGQVAAMAALLAFMLRGLPR